MDSPLLATSHLVYATLSHEASVWPHLLCSIEGGALDYGARIARALSECENLTALCFKGNGFRDESCMRSLRAHRKHSLTLHRSNLL